MDVKTAGRTVQIFEAFGDAQEPLSLTEIGRILHAPLSSCLYLVRALEQRGYLYPVGNRRNFYPTRKMLDIANAIAVGEPWMSQFEQALTGLRNRTRETVLLGKRQANRVVYLMVLEGDQTIRYSANIGDLKPLHSSSSGKALLSTLSPTERAKTVAKLPMEKITDATITDPAQLLADLEQIASRGYAIARGENVEDVMAIAKAVSLGSDLYSVVVAGPLARMEANLDKHAEALEAACKTIRGKVV
jgi:DNA-binding IclR family transcriptional regulator